MKLPEDHVIEAPYQVETTISVIGIPAMAHAAERLLVDETEDRDQGALLAVSSAIGDLTSQRRCVRRFPPESTHDFF